MRVFAYTYYEQCIAGNLHAERVAITESPAVLRIFVTASIEDKHFVILRIEGFLTEVVVEDLAHRGLFYLGGYGIET